MNKLGLIIKNEYLTDIRGKSFWIATFILPVVVLLFGCFGGFMMEGSDTFMDLNASLQPSPDPGQLTGLKIIGMLMGIFLVLFLMTYGSQIFNKVKVEKCNRIMEVLATCVTGRTMMLAKIIAVGLVGMTQLMLWGILVAVIAVGILIVFPIGIPWQMLFDGDVVMAFVWSLLFFIGGYVFYGSLFAAVGAMTDKNNENQEYIAVLTFILLGSFYIGEFAVDNGTSTFAIVCSYIPFTSPVTGCVNAIVQTVPVWQSLLSLLVLYGFALLSLAFSGKVYTSSLLLKGKRFSPRDIITFLKSK